MKKLLVILGLAFAVASFGQTRKVSTMVTAGDTTSTLTDDGWIRLHTIDGTPSTEAFRLHRLTDSLPGPVYNVKTMFGAKGDSLTDDTEAFRTAATTVKEGTLWIPSGDFVLTDSVLFAYGVKIVGAGSGLDGGTTILLTRNKPGFHFYADDGAGSYGTEYGTTISGVHFYGSATADSSGQHAITINGSDGIDIENNEISQCGGKGIRLGTLFNTDRVFIHDNDIHHNYSDGVFGQTTDGLEINHVVVRDNNISANGGHGVNLWGTASIRILENVIQGNDSCAVTVSHYGTTTGGLTLRNMTVKGNYFESNGGGSMFIRPCTGGGSDNDIIYNLVVDQNYSNENGSNFDKADQTANYTVSEHNGSTYLRNFKFRDNFCASTNTSHFDGNDDLTNDDVVEIGLGENAEFVNMGTASTIIGGKFSCGCDLIVGPTAVGGITASMLIGCFVPYITSAIDISADPQIVDGFDGQELMIIGYNDTNTLTLDDGTGLSLEGDASWVGGQGDIIVLKYHSTLDLWRELYRSAH